MHFARIVRGRRHTYTVSIVCPTNVQEIAKAVDTKIWSKKIIGGTVFLTAKTIRQVGVGSHRVRSGSLRPLDEGQKELLETADNLVLDAEWSGLISVLDTMGSLGYSLVCEGHREGVFYMQSQRSLPPLPVLQPMHLPPRDETEKT